MIRPYILIFRPDGNLYVCDGGNLAIGDGVSGVKCYDGTTGAFLGYFVPSGSSGLSVPTDMDFGPDGNLYVTSELSSQVLRYDGTTGAFMDVFASGNGLFEPISARFGPDGKLYVLNFEAGSYNPNVLRFNGTTGTFLDTFIPSIPSSAGSPYSLAFRKVAAPIKVTNLTLTPSTVIGCKPSLGKVTLESPAPAGGTTVSLSSSDPAVATVPASVTVPEGKTTAAFTIKTNPVTTKKYPVTTASSGGVTLSKTLTVKPIGVKSVTLSPDQVQGGGSATGIVILECPAAPGDITVTLTSSNTAVATVPGSLVIPAGSSVGTFTVNTGSVSALTTVKIKAKAGGVTKSAKLTLYP